MREANCTLPMDLSTVVKIVEAFKDFPKDSGDRGLIEDAILAVESPHAMLNNVQQ